MVIAPSILAGDFSKFGRELKRVEKTIANWVHLSLAQSVDGDNTSGRSG